MSADVRPVDEPLALSALLARRWARQCCGGPGAQLSNSCEAYHGLWQLLRLMGLGKTLGGHGSQYVQQFVDWANGRALAGPAGPSHVLVSGCADYSMLAHLLCATRAVGLDTQVTVLDQCETPLKLNQWYAQHVGYAGLSVIQADILQFQPERCFDLIVTSSFFGYFSPAQREALFLAYAGMLAPGGLLVFSNRLRSGPEDEPVGFTPAEALAFEARVMALAPTLSDHVRPPADDMRSLARRYVQLFHSHPLNGPATVERLARVSGLNVVRLDGLHHMAAQQGVSGPTTSDASPYVFAVLQRPAA